MSPRTMHILFVNVSAILVLLAMIQAQDLDIPVPTSPSTKHDHKNKECSVNETLITEVVTSRFFKRELHKTHLSSLIQMYFQLSLSYLFTSQQFASHFVQRPGMAKLLKEASDKKWEEGLDILKKSFQRGAMTDDIFKNFVASGKGYLSSGSQSGVHYVKTLEKLVKNSYKILKKTRKIYGNALGADDKCGDAELAHYFEDYMEAEAKSIREWAGHHFTLKNMQGLGVAISVFDSHM